jgi:hypothetical protein
MELPFQGLVDHVVKHGSAGVENASPKRVVICPYPYGQKPTNTGLGGKLGYWQNSARVGGQSCFGFWSLIH